MYFILETSEYNLCLLQSVHLQDEEDGDTYEAPPCERPTIKAPPRQVEENVYLGTSI